MVSQACITFQNVLQVGLNRFFQLYQIVRASRDYRAIGKFKVDLGS